MSYLTTKQKVSRFAEVVSLMPEAGEFVVLFDQGEIHNLAGERIASFGITLFDRCHPAEETIHADFDSALEEIDPSPSLIEPAQNCIPEKH